MNSNIAHQIDRYLCYLYFSKSDYETTPNNLRLGYYFFTFSQIIYAILEHLREYFLEDTYLEEYRAVKLCKDKIAKIIPHKLKHTGVSFTDTQNMYVDIREESLKVEVGKSYLKIDRIDTNIRNLEADTSDKYIELCWKEVETLFNYLSTKNHNFMKMSEGIFKNN